MTYVELANMEFDERNENRLTLTCDPPPKFLTSDEQQSEM